MDPDLRLYAGSYTNAAHNAFLQVWAESGLIGSLLFLIVLFEFYRKVGQRIFMACRFDFLFRVTLLSLMSAFLFQSMMNFTLQIPFHLLCFVVLLAAGASYQSKRGQEEDPVMILPITFQMRWGIRVTAWMKNIKIPVALGIHLDWRPSLRVATCIIVGMILIGSSHYFTRPLVADMFFRKARESYYLGATGISEELSRTALKFNRNHHDCRNLLSLILWQNDQTEESLEELQLVRRRLSALEVDARMGCLYYDLGEMDKARYWWRECIRRRPVISPSQSLEQQAEVFEKLAQ
jgi:hypothetical protein